MSQNTGFKILVYDMKPRERIEKDTLDDFVIEQARLKAEKLWDDKVESNKIKRNKENLLQIYKKFNNYYYNIQQPKQTTFQIVHGLNQVEDVVISKSGNDKQDDQKKNKQQSRVEKYWGVGSGVQFNDQRNLQPNYGQQQQQQQKDNSLLSNLSFQFGNQDKPIVRHQSQMQDDSKSIKDVLGQLSGNNNNNNNNQKKELQNQKKEKPFLVMPKAQLQQYLTDYKQQIIKEYKQQALLKGYKQQLIGEFNLNNNKKNPGEYDSKQLTESQYHRLLLNLDKSLNQSEQKELKQLQSELGLNQQDLANLDAYQYDQLLEMMNQ